MLTPQESKGKVTKESGTEMATYSDYYVLGVPKLSSDKSKVSWCKVSDFMQDLWPYLRVSVAVSS